MSKIRLFPKPNVENSHKKFQAELCQNSIYFLPEK